MGANEKTMNSSHEPVPQGQRPSHLGRRRAIFIALVGLIGAVSFFLVAGREAGLQRWFGLPPVRQDIASRDASEAIEEIDVIETDASTSGYEANWQPISLSAEPRRTRPKTLVKPKQQVVTVSGTARDHAGKPVPNALVRLMCLTTKPALVGTTHSDADGQFEFRDVEFVLRSNPDADFSAFSLIATAPTFGLSWQPWIYFLDCPRPTSPFPFAGQHLLPDTKEATFRDEPLQVTLTFGKPAVIEGRVISDIGDRVVDAEVLVNNLELLSHVGRPTQLAPHRFPSTDWLPEPSRVARTDADGSFRIVGLPAEALVGIYVTRADFVNTGVMTTTAQERLKSQQKVEPSPLRVVLRKPRQVSVQVQTADTKQPLEDVVVSAVGYQNGGSLSEYLQTRSSTSALLVPDKYWLDAKPMEESRYVTTHRQFEVTTGFEPQPHTIEVDRAATVEFEVVDVDTGSGVSGVQFWTTPQPPFQREQITGKAGPLPKRVPVQSDVYHPRPAKTDRDGRLRVSLKPARRRFEINLAAHLDYVASKPESDEVELRSGEATKVKFELKKP